MVFSKVGYATKKAAIDAIKHIAARIKQSYRAYLCPECGEYHITSIKNHKIKHGKKESKYPVKYYYNKPKDDGTKKRKGKRT